MSTIKVVDNANMLSYVDKMTKYLQTLGQQGTPLANLPFSRFPTLPRSRPACRLRPDALEMLVPLAPGII